MNRFCVFVFCVVFFIACQNKKSGFVKLDSRTTNITFNNTIFEDDTINIFDFANIYNGGGVGVGDFNNDGMQDLYFTGNMVPNKLYLNKGKMQFEDVTSQSKTDGGGIWSRGVAVIDINNDGLLDMYVCATAKRDPNKRVNILYVNQGVGADKIPVFKDMANEYGLADTSQSTMAYFFDYDNDGDLDLFIAVNHIVKDEYANTFRKKNLNSEHPSTCKLFNNEWSDSLKHPVYTEVSKTAGIIIEGYTHAANIFDVNNDGWLDILVLNDYISDNVLYINNQDGTFTDQVKNYFKHTAANSMGSDAVDINNDGWEDVIEVDMAPQDNYRKKMFQNASNYQMYLNSDQFGYQYQYTRNMVQLNMGPTIKEKDSLAHPVFADIGFMANIAETDWSWSPLVADFDHDRNKDIIFTNGFPKDITDHDFIVYRKQAYQLTSKKEMLSEIPEVKIHNYAYRNNGDLNFEDMSFQWGFEEPNFSSGAAYADLDNDGDLDVIINNIKDPASVYENQLNKSPGFKNKYLSINLVGSSTNKNAIGSKIEIYQKDQKQLYTQMPHRGYISSQSFTINAGLGENEIIDSVIIIWPDRKIQKLESVQANQTITIDYNNSDFIKGIEPPLIATNNWFTNITQQSGIDYNHQQWDFIDFNVQKLLPHKFSEYAPGIAAGDINGDGLDDFVLGGSTGYSPTIFLQTSKGSFTQSVLYKTNTNIQDTATKRSDDRGILLFDADNDGDLDMYITAGGYVFESNNQAYQDNFYVNDGNGHFTLNKEAIPVNLTSKFCIRASDYDKDGDLDLFISGRVDPHKYPKPVSSFIYRNETKNGIVKFTDVTKMVAPELNQIGLVCDGLFTDYDNDGWLDLILVGEWMSPNFFHNENGKFVNKSKGSGVQELAGWWNSITSGDFDNDGDMDYVIGNLGLNSFYRASTERPVTIYAKDFDDNDSYDAVTSVYLPKNTSENASWNEYPVFGREDMIKQMLFIRSRFHSFASYANTEMVNVIPPERMKDVLKMSANTLTSAILINDGNGKFSMKELPRWAQMSMLNGMVVEDFDQDGNLDIVINTNDYSTEPLIGRYDALNGIVLKGRGDGSFTPLNIYESGIYITGNGKAMSKIIQNDGNYLLLASQNKGRLEVFRKKEKVKMIKALPGDISVTCELQNGKKQKQEFYYGSSFLSQSSRFFIVNSNAKGYKISDINGNIRTVNLK